MRRKCRYLDVVLIGRGQMVRESLDPDNKKPAINAGFFLDFGGPGPFEPVGDVPVIIGLDVLL